MPELPEVETIRRGLEQLLVGMTIESVEIRLPKIFHGDVATIIGAQIQRIRRYGKGLLIDLDQGYSLAVHVKMTGQLIFKGTPLRQGFEGQAQWASIKNLHPALDAPTELPSKHTHVIFTLRTKNQEQRAKLYYNDIRQFGWIKVVKTDEAEKLPFFTSLGPEPLTTLTLEQFSTILSRSKAPIKQVLMDQSRMAGIGNIYANDALFYAGIHPLKPAFELRAEEIAKLFEGVEYVLTEGIKAGGASEENYVNAFGQKGFYQEKFLVYKQTGKPCKKCETPIERIVLGGRGTFFCPTCQV